jgi:hypothetical protein
MRIIRTGRYLYGNQVLICVRDHYQIAYIVGVLV